MATCTIEFSYTATNYFCFAFNLTFYFLLQSHYKKFCKVLYFVCVQFQFIEVYIACMHSHVNSGEFKQACFA